MSFYLKIQDLYNGTHIIPAYKALKESEQWTAKEQEEYRLKRIRLLLDHANQNVPYYTELFKSIGLQPYDVRDLDTFFKIPILDKNTAKSRLKDLTAQNIKLNSRKIKKGKTGGTTGAPLNLYKDISTRSATWGAYYRWYDWMGIKPNDRSVLIWGDAKVLSKDYLSSLKNSIRERFSHTKLIRAFNLNPDSMANIVDELLRYKPVLIRGYLSAIIQIGQYLEKHSIVIPELKAVSPTTETLLPTYREYLQKVFGVPIFDQYGCGECGSIAFECSSHTGMHITEEHVFIEILDVNDTHTDEIGKIVLTDLDNYAMPFIRYENGDQGKLSNDLCSCGRQSRLLKAVEGRTIDTIRLKDGSLVHGVFFTDILYELNNRDKNKILRFQVYQDSKGGVEFRIEGIKETFSPEFISALQSKLELFFQQIQIKFYKNLKNDKNGKFRYILTDLTSA